MGCTKEIDIIDRFNFDFDVILAQEGYVYEANSLDIKINPDNVVNGTTYTMSFKIVEGTSYMETYSPTIKVVNDDEYIIPSSNQQAFKYLSTTVGLNKIIITIEDSNGLIKTKEISFVAKLAPFTYLLTPNLNSYTINKGGAMTATILRKEVDSFQFSYVVENGTGLFYDGVTVIPVGKPYLLKNGVKELNYIPSTLGAHKVISTVTASDGATIERIVNVIVDNVPFALNATSSATTINVNQEIEINIDLTEQQKDANATYQITHSYDTGGISGVLKNASNTSIIAGVYSTITPGNYKYKFKPNSLGTATITFKVKDSNGQIKEATIIIVVSNVQFTFTAVASEKTVLLNEKSNLNFNLIPNTADSNGVTYNYFYEGVSGDGILSDANGTEIKKGSPITVNKGSFTFRYKPTSLGSHILNFTVTDNSGEVRTASIEITTVHTPVTFNVSSVTQTYVNQGVNIDFVVTPQSSNNLTYLMNYYVSGGAGQLINNATEIPAGNYFNVEKGTFRYNFIPNIAGNYTLSFELKDSNGQIVKKDILLVVLNNEFTFTPSQSQNVYVNESNVFSYALVPTGNYKNTTYTVSYTLEAGQLGSLYKDEIEIQQGVPFNVTPTSFNLAYKPTSIGIHKIIYTVTDSNGLSKVVTQTIKVVASDFILKTQQANTTIYKNTNDVILLSLAQEQSNPNIIYSLTYTITGVGQVLDNGVPLNNMSVIKTGNHSYTFVSPQSGNSEIVFSIIDSNGILHNSTVKYIVINSTFTLSSAGDGTLNLGKTKEFNVYVSQVVPDVTATYQIRYLIESGSVGNGTISIGNTVVPFGVFQDIAVGGTTLHFLGTENGEVKLKVEVKDSNGVIKSSNLIFIVNQINYIFTGAAQNNTIFVNGSTPINFDITEGSASGTNYEMKYAITEGNAQIKNGATVENANQYYPVSIGSFNKTFVGTNSGTIKVLFTVRNLTTLVEKTQLVNVTVNPSVFTFTASGTNNNQTVTTPINVNFNLTQTGGGGETYSMVFNSTKTGTFTYGGISYTAGQVIPFVVGSSNGTYTGSVSGKHDITFTVTSNNTVTKTATVSLDYITNDFTLATSGDGTLNINTTKNFNVFLSQANTDNAITYQVKYTIGSGTVGSGELSMGGTAVAMETFAPIALGTSQLTFKGTGEGTVNIVVTVKDSNNITHTSTLIFNVKAVDYIFTGAAQNNTIFVNGSTPINFDITESSASGTNYEMKYAITEGNAQIKNGATVENANQYYPVSIGSFNKTFVGTTVGTVKVLFTVRNLTTLVEKTQSVNVTVNPSDFSFNATRTNTGQVVNTPVPINLNLTQTSGNGDTYSLRFTTSSTGTFKYGGITYTAGEIIPFIIGASSGDYVSSVSGNHNITFTVTNQLNLSKTANVSLSYINNDFTLSSSGDGSLYLNQTKDFNVFLSQLTPDPNITYQVKYSFDSGTTGDGTISNGGNPVALGSYKPINLNSTPLTFSASAVGTVNVLIEVKNSNGLLKSTIVMFNIKTVEFTFTGGAQNSNIYVNDNTFLNFDLSEVVPSGTNYEMSFYPSEGNATIKDSGNTLNSYQWYDITTGAFQRELTALTQGSISMVFTVRNKTTLQKKTITVTINAYQKPTLTNIRTGEGNSDTFNCGGGECTRTYSKFLSFTPVINSGATLKSVIITVGWGYDLTSSQSGTKTFVITDFTTGTSNNFPIKNPGSYNGYINFDWFNADIRGDYYFNGQNYTLEVTDSNGIKSTLTGVFSSSFTDFQ